MTPVPIDLSQLLLMSIITMTLVVFVAACVAVTWVNLTRKGF